MKSVDLGRCVFGVTVAMLAACGGAQTAGEPGISNAHDKTPHKRHWQTFTYTGSAQYFKAPWGRSRETGPLRS
jgi:hypothetical protein